MNTFIHFAQASEQLAPLTESGLSDGAGGVIALTMLVLFSVVGLVLALIGYIVSSLCLMQIFKKAGVPAWIAWVPFYNNWKVLEIGGQQGFWAVLAIIPVVNIVSAVMLYIAQFHIGLKLGKSGVFLLWALFFPIVWFLWLAFDKSTWNDAASPEAPSLHVPEFTPAAGAFAPAQPVQPTQPIQSESNLQQ